MKENLEPVPGDGILQKISDVDVYTYDYIEGPKDKLGLMAEDFHQVFERGSDKTINGQEVQMALWLAVQELEKRSTEQKKLIDQQQSLMAEQRSLVAEQQKQMLAQARRIKQLELLVPSKRTGGEHESR